MIYIHSNNIILLSLLLLLLLCNIINCLELIGNDDLPWFKDTDSIELYHLSSFSLPLIITSKNNYNIRTSGIALRNTRSYKMVVFEYKPINYSSCYLPKIKHHKDDSEYPVWDKRAYVDYQIGIDTSYWEHSTYLATMNGVVYKNYIRWIEDYVKGNGQFLPHSICANTNDTTSPCYVTAFTADTFLSESFTKFASMGVSLHAVIPPRGIEIRILSQDVPVVVNSTDSNNNEVLANNLRRSNIESRVLTVDNNIDNAGKHHKKNKNIVSADSVAKYYKAIINCMEDHPSDDFAVALSSCYPSTSFDSQSTALVHYDAETYYQITPKFPYVFSYDYPQAMPPPQYGNENGASVEDVGIIGVLVLFTLVGMILALVRMQVFEGCCSKLNNNSITKIVRKAPPSTGGYSPGASELPYYAMRRTSSFSGVVSDNNNTDSSNKATRNYSQWMKGLLSPTKSYPQENDDDTNITNINGKTSNGPKTGSRFGLSNASSSSRLKYSSISTIEDTESPLGPFRNPFDGPVRVDMPQLASSTKFDTLNDTAFEIELTEKSSSCKNDNNSSKKDTPLVPKLQPPPEPASAKTNSNCSNLLTTNTNNSSIQNIAATSINSSCAIVCNGSEKDDTDNTLRSFRKSSDSNSLKEIMFTDNRNSIISNNNGSIVGTDQDYIIRKEIENDLGFDEAAPDSRILNRTSSGNGWWFGWQ